eukprot:TRINITY_DN79442_c0_g1_i1.p1 TRINITY_DN79442_c0_g1~~TRINITY_DN79442_c0_g1_i1.p1  ORF type:complete len:338 (-),score=69.48 TRINITY_DN79442_c0_g1_i1:124-1137(-)
MSANIAVAQREEVKIRDVGQSTTVDRGYFIRLHYLQSCVKATTFGEELVDGFSNPILISLMSFLIPVELYFIRVGILALFITDLICAFTNVTAFTAFVWIGFSIALVYIALIVTFFMGVHVPILLLWRYALLVRTDSRTIGGSMNTFIEVEKTQKTGIAAEVNLDNELLRMVSLREQSQIYKFMLYTFEWEQTYKLTSPRLHLFIASFFIFLGMIWNYVESTCLPVVSLCAGPAIGIALAVTFVTALLFAIAYQVLCIVFKVLNLLMCGVLSSVGEWIMNKITGNQLERTLKKILNSGKPLSIQEGKNEQITAVQVSNQGVVPLYSRAQPNLINWNQ